MSTDLDLVKLTRRMRSADAFADLATAWLHGIAALLDSIAHRDHPDDTHALRLAVRHLRALHWVFGPALPSIMDRRWRDDLPPLMQAVGPLRDWDVFIAGTLQQAIEREPEDPVLAALLEAATTRRLHARSTMLARLTEYRHWPLPVLLRDVIHLKSGSRRQLPRAARLPVAELARKRVRKCRGQVRALARKARDGDLRNLHRLRIRGKRLRYAIEDLAAVLPARYKGPLRKKLKKQQDGLGQRLDDAVARRLMAECLQMPGPDQATGKPPGQLPAQQSNQQPEQRPNPEPEPVLDAPGTLRT